MLLDPPQLEQRPVAELRPHPLNPRGPVDPASLDELVASVRAQGVLQPLLVTPDGVIVAGHRRHAAALRAGLAVVPIVVRAMSEAEQVDAMLAENIQREDLTPLQEATAYRRILDAGRTVADLARSLGVNRERIARRLELLQLCPEVQAMFDRYELALTLGRHLLRVGDWPTQRRIATFAAERGYPAERVQLGGLSLVGVRPLPAFTTRRAALGPHRKRNAPGEEHARDR